MTRVLTVKQGRVRVVMEENSVEKALQAVLDDMGQQFGGGFPFDRYGRNSYDACRISLVTMGVVLSRRGGKFFEFIFDVDFNVRFYPIDLQMDRE